MGFRPARRSRALVRRLGARPARAMTTVVVAPFDVVSFPDGAGHFWVYMQYVQGLRRLGCDVWWLEQVQRRKHKDGAALATFRARMAGFGMAGRPPPYHPRDGARDARDDAPIEWLDRRGATA